MGSSVSISEVKSKAEPEKPVSQEPTEHGSDSHVVIEIPTKPQQTPKYLCQINRPLDAYHSVTKNTNSNDDHKRSLALCHGHNHSIEILSKISNAKYWYMVDYDITCYPDYVGDVSSKSHMSYFPDQYFDIIVSAYCFVGKDRGVKYIKMLKNISRIIKPDGRIYLTELPGLFYWFIDTDIINKLKGKIMKIIGEQNFNEYKDLLIKEYTETTINILGEETFSKNKKTFEEEIVESFNDDEVYSEILCQNYYGENEELVNEMLKKKSIKYTKIILEKYGFEIVEMNNLFLVIKLSN